MIGTLTPLPDIPITRSPDLHLGILRGYSGDTVQIPYRYPSLVLISFSNFSKMRNRLIFLVTNRRFCIKEDRLCRHSRLFSMYNPSGVGGNQKSLFFLQSVTPPGYFLGVRNLVSFFLLLASSLYLVSSFLLPILSLWVDYGFTMKSLSFSYGSLMTLLCRS